MSAAEIPESVRLEVGEDREFRLPSLGAAGFVWTARTDGPAVQVDHTREQHGSHLAGASASEIVVIHAIAEGTATVRLEQRRPWEASAPLHSVTVEVSVVPGA
jgi:predicted secreted protein